MTHKRRMYSIDASEFLNSSNWGERFDVAILSCTSRNRRYVELMSHGISRAGALGLLKPSGTDVCTESIRYRRWNCKASLGGGTDQRKENSGSELFVELAYEWKTVPCIEDGDALLIDSMDDDSYHAQQDLAGRIRLFSTEKSTEFEALFCNRNLLTTTYWSLSEEGHHDQEFVLQHRPIDYLLPGVASGACLGLSGTSPYRSSCNTDPHTWISISAGEDVGIGSRWPRREIDRDGYR
jgi:hypothetical protein